MIGKAFFFDLLGIISNDKRSYFPIDKTALHRQCKKAKHGKDIRHGKKSPATNTKSQSPSMGCRVDRFYHIK